MVGVVMEDVLARVVVFVGPTLRLRERPTSSEFVWMQPAQAGDLFELCGARPRAAVILDGFFDERPAVRHKEILSLISEGVPVLGASSMGALRAAELHEFGMIGVGHIFIAYATGRIEGDDEVALLHGPEDLDWCPLTEPLINIRATLVASVRNRICDLKAARVIFDCARGVFYKERTWPLLLDRLLGGGQISPRRLKAFSTWLPTGKVDLKRIDALECLRACVGPLPIPQRMPPPETLFSEQLRRQVHLRGRRD